MKAASVLLALASTLPVAALGAQEPVLVTGAVSDPAGRPLGSVEIRLAEAPGEAKPLARTDEDGLFWLEAPPGSPLRFEAPGRLARTVETIPAGAELQVVLPPAASLVLQVQGEDAAPLAESEVRIFKGDDGLADEKEPEPLAVASTSKEGRAVFEELPPGLYRLEASAEDHREAKKTLALAGGRRSLLLSLEPVVFVEGRILDEAGEPLAGALVGEVPGRRSRAEEPFRADYRVPEWVETGEQGRYRLPLTSGRSFLRILARAPGHAPRLLVLGLEEEQDPVLPDLVLGPSLRASGRVVDGEGRAVPGIRVHPQVKPEYMRDGEAVVFNRWLDLDLLSGPKREADETPEPILSDEDGRFEFGGLGPGELRLVVLRPGAHPKEGEPVEVPEGAGPADLEVVWDPGRSLVGVVLDGEDRPVPDAQIQAAWREESRQKRLEVRTDADGRFELAGIPGDTVQTLTVEAEGYGTAEKRGLALDGEPVTVRVHPAGALRGLVLDEFSGSPVPAFLLEAIPIRRGDRILGHREREEFSSPEGRFRFDGLTEGIYTLRVHSERHLTRDVEQVEVQVGRTTEMGPVFLERGGIVRGRVTDAATGLPVPDARVWPRPLEGTRPKDNRMKDLTDTNLASTDLEGAFELAGLAMGEYLFTVDHPDFATWRQPIALTPEQPQVIREISLGVGATLEITVRDASGQPVEDRRLYLHPSKTYPLRHRSFSFGEIPGGSTDESGRLVLDKISPGEYRLNRHRFEGDLGGRPVRLEEGEVKKITLSDTGTRLHGTVLRDGRPAPGAEVALRIQHQRRGMAVVMSRDEVIASDGTYSFDALAPGRYSLQATLEVPDPDAPEGIRELAATDEIEIPEGLEELHQDLVFPSLEYSGRVIRKDTGEGVEGAFVWARPPGPMPSSFFVPKGQQDKTDATGAFELTLPHRGPFEISVNLRGEGFVGWKLDEEPTLVTLPEGEGLTDQVLLVVPGRTVEGLVTGPGGRPLPDATVWVRPLADMDAFPFRAWRPRTPGGGGLRTSGSVTYSRRTDVEGRYKLIDAPEGRVLVTATHPDHAPAWKSDVVVGLEGARADLALPTGGSLEIRLPEDDETALVLTRPGLPVPIRITPLTWHGEYVVVRPGTWTLTQLPPGTWTVTLEHPSGNRRETVEILPGERAALDLRGQGQP